MQLFATFVKNKRNFLNFLMQQTLAQVIDNSVSTRSLSKLPLFPYMLLHTHKSWMMQTCESRRIGKDLPDVKALKIGKDLPDVKALSFVKKCFKLQPFCRKCRIFKCGSTTTRKQHWPVASLRMVTPGAEFRGVTLHRLYFKECI